MRSRNRRTDSRENRIRESGLASVEFLAAVGFSLLLLVVLTNLLMQQYGRGVVRAAADEAARAGTRVVDDPLLSCRNRAKDVLADVGRLIEAPEITCSIVDGRVRAEVSATLTGWMPPVPDRETSMIGLATKEVAPS